MPLSVLLSPEVKSFPVVVDRYDDLGADGAVDGPVVAGIRLVQFDYSSFSEPGCVAPLLTTYVSIRVRLCFFSAGSAPARPGPR